MKYVIFYSWQSDLANNTNRGFIESVIKKAIKDVHETEAYDLEPSVDRDTQGLPGAPNITQAILDKIRTCDVFVADISIVTGDKKSGQRPSPNPNVLLELGYAIALLGWEKIILFCNEIHGSDEDLPFDIRQHRRIAYKLQQDDPKASLRNDLAKHFKDRLIELLQKGKASLAIKQPLLDISWNYINLEEGNKVESGIDSKVIELKRIDDISDLKDRIEQEIQATQKVDGSIDPDWDVKLANYVKKANLFIEQLDDETNKKNYLIDFNAAKTFPVTLSVDNDGNAAASDIRVEIPIPEWLLAFEEFPEKNGLPKKPDVPVPMPQRITNSIKTFGQFSDFGRALTGIKPSPFIMGNHTRTSACCLKENEIFLWADRLLHKHVITNRNDRFLCDGLLAGLPAVSGSPS